MIIDRGKKRSGIFLLALVCAILLVRLPSSAQQVDPFYLRILERAQKSFIAKDFWIAAQDFEIAAFGLNQDPVLKAKAYFFIGLSQFYLKDIGKSESYVRQAVELLGERDLGVLELPGSVLPDLEKLLTFFGIQVAKPLPLPDPLMPQENEAKEQPTEASPKDIPEDKKPAEKTAANTDQKERLSTTPPTLASLKEGDLIPLNLVDKLPVAIRRVPAVYPAHAQAARIEGNVMVNALISEKGSVLRTEIIQGLKGVAGFDQAAAQAVRRWKFEPATIKGIKVKVWMPISIVFKAQE
jgi:TonB family protein